jgi:hypothetical protein
MRICGPNCSDRRSSEVQHSFTNPDIIIIIIIIIIFFFFFFFFFGIGPYSLTSASFRMIAHTDLSSAFFLHLLTPIDLRPFSIQSSHLNFGLPTFLLPSGYCEDFNFAFGLRTATDRLHATWCF